MTCLVETCPIAALILAVIAPLAALSGCIGNVTCRTCTECNPIYMVLKASLDHERVPHPDEGPWIIVEKLEHIPGTYPEEATIRLRKQCQTMRLLVLQRIHVD